MKHRLIVILLTCFIPLVAYSEVTWTLFGGGMYRKQRGASGPNTGSPNSKSPSWDIIGGLYLQIPIALQNKLSIETGFNYRNQLMVSVEKGRDLLKENTGSYGDFYNIFHGNSVEMPVKAVYNLSLNKKNSFHFGLGPYASYCIGDVYGSPVTVGLTASVNYKFRSLNLGIAYYNTTFYNGPNNYYKNSAVFTVGVTFGRKTWSTIGKGAAVAGTVAGVLAESYLEVQEQMGAANGDSMGSGNSMGSPGYDPENGYQSSANGGNADTEIRMYQKWEDRARDIIESMDGHSMSPSNISVRKKELRKVQREMQKCRRRAGKKGVNIPQSPYETQDVKIL